MLSDKQITQLKEILEDACDMKLSDEAIKRIITFIVAYINLIKKIDINS